jgi:hypothetical protein
MSEFVKYVQKQYDAPHDVSTGVCVAKIGDQVTVGVVSNEYRVTRIEDPGTHQGCEAARKQNGLREFGNNL